MPKVFTGFFTLSCYKFLKRTVVLLHDRSHITSSKFLPKLTPPSSLSTSVLKSYFLDIISVHEISPSFKKKNHPSSNRCTAGEKRKAQGPCKVLRIIIDQKFSVTFISFNTSQGVHPIILIVTVKTVIYFRRRFHDRCSTGSCIHLS